MKGQDIISRCRRLESDRSIVEEKWEIIERYIAPYRGRFYFEDDDEASQEWRKPWIYDGTAIQASQNLSASLHSSLTSPTTQFYLLHFRNKDLRDNQLANEWLEECGKRLYFALQESNFNVEISEVYTDLVNYGTSFLTEEISEDGKEINFKSIPVKECFWEEDSQGLCFAYYRKFQWTPVQMLDYFGEEGLPDEIVEEAQDPNTDTSKKYKIVFCVYKRPSKADADVNSVLAPSERPVGFKYVLENDGTELGEQGGYYEMPVFATRWRSTNGSKWGNSPAMVAISDTLTLNRLIELNLIAIDKVIDPPTITSQRGLIGNLNLKAGGVTVVRDINELKPYESGARFDVTYEEIARLRESVKDYFFINQLILPPMGTTPPTATEITVRMQQLERLIGPTLGRIMSDLLDPLISRTFNLMMRAGLFPEVPADLIDQDAELEIEYVSPMAKTQEASNVAAIERYIMLAGNTAQFNPNILDVPNFDELLRTAGKGMGIPSKCNNDQAEVDVKRRERQEQEQAMAQGAAMEQLGTGMQAMNQANEGGEAVG